MKRKYIRRITNIFLSMLLMCICLVSVFAISVTAASHSGYEYKTNYTTTDKKPTYTATLNENNKLLKQLNKKENKILKKVKNEGKDWVNDAFKLTAAIKNSSIEDMDWLKIGNEIAKNIITSIAGAWGLDGVTGAILDGIEAITSSGEAPLSEVEILSDNINKHFNATSDKLYDIENQLAELSNQVTTSVNSVLSKTQSQINNLEAKQILRSFMSSGEGNFSYLEYSNYLYGNKNNSTNISESYYIRLLETIQAGGSEELIEYYYNKLFESIYTNISIYNQYYFGDIAGLDKSIAAYYYDYLSYNQNLVDKDKSAEYQALLFALDLYTTYVYSYEILEMCFAYQVTNMYLNAINEGRDIRGTDFYWYSKTDSITYSTIQEEVVSMNKKLVAAEEQVVEDIAYILGMQSSYIVIDDNGDVHAIGDHGPSFGNIANKQVIYLNIIPDEICNLFELNPNNFRYYVNDKEFRAENKGIIDSNEISSYKFTASVSYGNVELYNIDFTKIDEINNNKENTPIKEFSGGSGTIDDPYLISNAVQLYMVNDDLNAYYKLISDITLTGTHFPIGTEEKPFYGTFDGNGYTISNMIIESLGYDETNITMTPTTGMFGTIGRKDDRIGVVKNLTLTSLNVISDLLKDKVYPENDISYYCVGGIAGINKGIISNCTIKNNSSIIVNRNKETKDSRSVEIYIGGITGSNGGVIEFCSIDGLSISGNSLLYFYNESAEKNKLSLYAGGIAAVTSNMIKYCRVSDKCTISAYAKSIANSKNDVKPYLLVYVGGIIADDSATQYISNVYSACNFASCKGEIYNEGTYIGIHRYSWNNVSIKQGSCFPTFFPLSSSDKIDDYEMNFYKDIYQNKYNGNYRKKIYEIEKRDGIRRQLSDTEKQEIIDQSKIETKHDLIEKRNTSNTIAINLLGEKVLTSYTDTCFTPKNNKIDISIELEDNVCDINSKYLSDYFNKLIDEKNEVKNIKFLDTDKNVIDANVVSYYGFNTYHESETEQTITVKVFFYVNDTLMYDDVTLIIKAKEIVDWKIKDFINTPFKKEMSTDECLDKIFEYGFRLEYTYSNGQIKEYFINKSNKNTVDINNLIITECGKRTIVITHNEQPNVGKTLKFEQTIEVVCYHNNADFRLIDTILANCKSYGYEIWKCSKCDKEIHKNFVKGDHTYVVSSGEKATCYESGYSQKVFCPICGKVFEESEFIQSLDHNYVSAKDDRFCVDVSHPATKYHYCTNGNHYEAHQCTVKECIDKNGTLVYLYTCACGYENPVYDYNIITKENGEKPLVVVTNGYVLNIGDKVVVYVQILNNPGFIGATFGIRYDNGLELISVEESMMVPQQLAVRNEVNNGYNFLWAKDERNKTSEDGYLLKMMFKYVDERKEDQKISIVYDMSNGPTGGFCTSDGGYHMFMTQSGTISVVDHLPGDVNNNGKGDGVVDIMDATYIAWYIVGKKDENGNKIQVDARYADVNLDGEVNLLDVLAILQSISGHYGTNLIGSYYKLFFNLNGFVCDDVDQFVMVKFYDEDGCRTKWNENIDFEKYKALMNRLGYNFVGWYTRIDCSCKDNDCTHIVNSDKFIKYDKNQKEQTLYARWEKNKITFDINGATSETIEDFVFDSEKPICSLPVPNLSYSIDYYVTGYEGIYKTLDIYKEFEGWFIEGTDTRVTELNLSQPNIGNVKVVARWSSYKWNKPIEDRDGYADVSAWYYKNYYANEFMISQIDDTTIKNIIDNGCNLYGKENLISYKITYINNDKEYKVTEYKVTDEKALSDVPDCPGYSFVGWFDSKGNKRDKIEKGSFGDIILTAKWKATIYKVTIKGIDVNQSYLTDSKGNPKYNPKDFGILYYTFGDETNDEGFYVDETCANKLTINYFDDYCVNTRGKTNFVFDGLYSSIISDNGHTYASYESESCILSARLTLESKPKFGNETGTLYALLTPNLYTVSLDINSSGILDNIYTTGTYSGNNLTIAYDSVTKKYTLTNDNTNDPNCTIGQYVYLEANVDYYVHMSIEGSNKANAIQMFYGIDGVYTEKNSVRFGGDQTQIIQVNKSGKYLIRFDNDTNAVLTITNFWITPLFTREINCYYNEVYTSSLVMPSTKYYKPLSYNTDSGIKYFNDKGISNSIYSIDGCTKLYCQWTQEYEGTYIINKEELMNIGTAGKYYIITDINLSGTTWSEKNSFSGELNGLGHTVSNTTLTIGGWKTVGSIAGGFFKELTNNAVISNIMFVNINVSLLNDDYASGISNKDNRVYAGVLCGKNYGTIENVEINTCSIWSYFYKNESGGSGIADKSNFVGGIAGINSGTIKDSNVVNSTISAETKSSTNSRGKWNYIGGICGINTGKINNSKSMNNVLKSVNSEKKTNPYIGDYAGNNSGTITNDCTANNNSIVK